MQSQFSLLRYDYVEIYDGRDASSKQLGHFCGNQVMYAYNVDLLTLTPMMRQ